ncbi:CD1247 N-terminal domain-containing protein [Fusibacter bizertensis]
MSYMHEKVAYLQGLAEGMEISSDSKEGKLLLQIIEVLEDFADEVDSVYDELDDLNDAVVELDDYLETIDEDLATLEDDVYELDDDDFEDDEDEDFEEVECPDCGESFFVDGNLIDKGEDVECPNCGVIIEFTDECDCCGEEGCDCCEE